MDVEERQHASGRGGEPWQRQASFQAPERAPGDQFGYALDLEGDQLAVGAPDALGPQDLKGQDGERVRLGAAYLYQLTDQTESAPLAEATQPYTRDLGPYRHINPRFGAAVSFDAAEGTLAVGAPADFRNVRGVHALGGEAPALIKLVDWGAYLEDLDVGRSRLGGDLTSARTARRLEGAPPRSRTSTWAAGEDDPPSASP